MKKRAVIILATGLVIASLARCGTQTDATDQQISESGAETESEAEEMETDEITSEEVIGGEIGETGIEIVEDDETITFYDEKGNQDYPGISDMTFEPYDGVIEAKGYVPAYDEEGFFVADITPGYSVSVTAKSDTLARYENPIAGTEYDYLYTPIEYMTKEVIMRSATEMVQYLQEYIQMYGLQDIDYTFVAEKASDMEVYEFRIDPTSDQMMLDYWIDQSLSFEQTDVFKYGTLYIECEEDTDGWIICRIYYKDEVESEY